MSQPTENIGSLSPGLNNRLPQTQLGFRTQEGKKTWLAKATNVDLDELGRLQLRKGYTLRTAGRTHSLWSDKFGGFVVLDGDLRSFDGEVGGAIRSGMPEIPVSYSRGADGDVYWSNGQNIRRIADGVDSPIAAQVPVAPWATTGSGALSSGRYLIAFTYSSADGESAATPVQALQVPVNGSIEFAAASQPSGGVLNAYVSAPDGAVMFLAATTTGGAVSIAAPSNSGREISTLDAAQLPPGQIVRHFLGRLVVASGSVLYYSLPFNYGLYKPSAGFVPFPERITVVEPVDGGLYIAAGKTYFLPSFDAELREVLPYDAVEGTSGHVPNTGSVYWRSQRGLVIGDANGQVRNIQEAALDFEEASSGASLFREQDGNVHVVASVLPSATANASIGAVFTPKFIP